MSFIMDLDFIISDLHSFIFINLGYELRDWILNNRNYLRIPLIIKNRPYC